MWVLPYFGVSGPQAGPFSHTLARFLPPNGQWEDFPRTRIHSLHGPAREPHRTLNRINNSSNVKDEDSLKSKILAYEQLRRPNIGVDEKGERKRINVIDWWFSKRDDFPTLSRMALDLAATPPESADLERKFSDAGNTLTDKRNRLKPETIEAIECLKSIFRELGG